MYDAGEVIFEGRKSRVLRAHGPDGPVIVKQLRGLYPTAATLARFRREFEITRAAAGDGVIRAIEQRDDEGVASIVLEDFGGRSLSEAIGGRVRPLAETLALAIQIADALAHIHATGVVHKDVTPANLVLNERTGVVKLIDFGISQVLARESPQARPVSSFEGTPRYMSPEQTGRMNRSVDSRSDLYSFGATLYELLTGAPPFDADDRLALVHAHLAKQPTPPHALRDDVPRVVSELVLTLLAKRPEDRYRSAAGVAHDLRRCLDALDDAGRIGDVPLRERDFDGQLRIPQKLYGRTAEIATLLDAFESAADGASRVVLVAGYSGVGKTSLVREIHRVLFGRRGSFVEGKVDQFNRGTPYGALIQALRGLMRQLLTEDADAIDAWRTRLAEAVGVNGRVLTDVVPEAAHVLGPQPPAEELPPAEARNRFQLVLSATIRACARPDHPLVLFLDDLQWADLPSLELIDRLVSDIHTRHVLWLGAYRDNEVGPTHPLTDTIARMRADGAALDEIALGPLDENDVLQLVSETVGRAPGHLRLAVTCHAKTRGNAFFLRRFLEGLHEDGHLRFDDTRACWTWDQQRVDAEAITDNVVEYLAAKIRKLDNSARALPIAACIGSRFDLRTLAYVLDSTRSEALESLREALAAELIQPAEEGFWFSEQIDEDTNFRYAFVHDRIRHAARSLLTDDEAAPYHLRVARYLLDEVDDEEREPLLFELVDHLDRGAALIDDPALQAKLVTLNHTAGQRAVASAAFSPAHTYYTRALAALPDDAWATDYATTLPIHLEGARAAYLAGDHPAMAAHVATVEARATAELDRVAAQEVAVTALVAEARFEEAVDLAIDLLARLDVHLPRTPTDADIQAAVAGALERLQSLTDADIDALPEVADPLADAAMRIQNSVMSAAYIGVPRLLPIMAANIVRTTLTHGASRESPYSFVVYSIVLTTLGMVDVGYRSGCIGVRMLDRWDERSIRARTIHVFTGMVAPFTTPLRDSIDGLRAVYQLGFDTGDLEFAAWALHMQCGNGLYAGEDLEALAERMEHNVALLEQHKQRQALGCTYQFRQAVANLRGEAPDPTRLRGPRYDETRDRQALRDSGFRGGAFILSTIGTYVRYLFRDLQSAVEYADDGAEYADGATCTYHIVWWHQFRALAILALARSPEDLAPMAGDIHQLEAWQPFAPHNHDHRVALIRAEMARVEGRTADAMDLYDRSIHAAHAHNFLGEEALALELAGRFHLARGGRTAARAYLLEACQAYARWGAWAKTEQLESEFADILGGHRIGREGVSTTATTSTTGGSSTRSVAGLDLDTLFKAASAISSEIVLENLGSTIMDVAIENAGATRGVLMLERDGELRVEAAKDADGNPIQDPTLPTTIAAYVARTGEPLVLEDARNDPRWSRDPALPRDTPISVLCAPITHQGIRRGIVYLENTLTPAAFTPARMQVMELLSTQAAISITNAQLYKNLQASLQAQVQLTDAHKRFVPNEFLENLQRASIVDVALGDSVCKEMSILFSDMHAFTTHVEGLRSEERIRFINSYLSYMEPPIVSHAGFVDSYIGDAIMALFDGAIGALDAAVEMLQALERLNGDRAATGKPPIRIGLGVNTGELTLGTIGGPTRIKCGVIGDSVNVAARVESLTRTYQVSLLTTDRTLSRLPDPARYATRPVDRAIVVGKTEPITLYEVFDADPPERRSAKLSVAAPYTEALAHYYDRRFPDAIALLEQCQATLGEDAVITTFLARARAHATTPPPASWTGVERLDHK